MLPANHHHRLVICQWRDVDSPCARGLCRPLGKHCAPGGCQQACLFTTVVYCQSSGRGADWLARDASRNMPNGNGQIDFTKIPNSAELPGRCGRLRQKSFSCCKYRTAKESDKAASRRPRLADTQWKLSLLRPPDSRTSSCSSPSRLPWSLDRLFESRFQAADAEPANDYPGAVSAFSSSCCSTNPSSVESVSATSLSPHLSRRPPTFPAAELLNSLCLRAPR